MATVYFDEATRTFPGGDAPAVDHVTLDIEDGEFLVLVGPSGCGKSTTLRMLAGLEPITDGRILIDGHDQKGVRPRDRDVAMVFQSYALYPNMTAAENMGFALTNAKVSSYEIKERVAEAAQAVISLDTTLIVTGYFGALPKDTIVFEVEPEDLNFGDGFSPAVETAVAELVGLLEKEVARRD